MTTTGRPAPTPQDTHVDSPDSTSPVSVTDFEIRLANGPSLLSTISLSLQAGKIAALTGPSGSGKTTLLRALIGDLPQGAEVTSGTVQALGQDVFALSSDALRALRRHRIAYVGQDPGSALNPRLSAEQLITEVASETHPDAVTALMTECRLPLELAHHRPGALSGGQQQPARSGPRAGSETRRPPARRTHRRTRHRPARRDRRPSPSPRRRPRHHRHSGLPRPPGSRRLRRHGHHPQLTRRFSTVSRPSQDGPLPRPRHDGRHA